ncbi:gamma-glutamyl hydrolase-like [Ornithodoros turicata]|uniref:gamma-glutamyl hydrolase-like n=1 Tax=Ornithodoros turicata TaxID=34597 RepID=UPI00313911D8
MSPKSASVMDRALLLLLFYGLAKAGGLNMRPIIGILAQHSYKGPTHISASYVKFVESAGARVVPIFVDKEYDYYEQLFNSTNGFLFPGGSVSVEQSGYSKAARILLRLAIQANHAGSHYPVWGTCLGLEELMYLQANQSIMKLCKGHDIATTLNFTQDFRHSGLFQELPRALERALTKENITYNMHQWCITPENFTKYGIDDFYDVLSTSRDADGLTFISTVQAKHYPIYATQWHPEKAAFEWVDNAKHQHLPHSENAVKVMQYVADYFVHEARKNNHAFESKEVEAKTLIYNYPVTYMGENSSSVQEYIFH